MRYLFSLKVRRQILFANNCHFWLTNQQKHIIINFVGSQKWRNWQTRTVQVRVVVIPCGFDSHLLQAEEKLFDRRRSESFFSRVKRFCRISRSLSGAGGIPGEFPGRRCPMRADRSPEYRRPRRYCFFPGFLRVPVWLGIGTWRSSFRGIVYILAMLST